MEYLFNQQAHLKLFHYNYQQYWNSLFGLLVNLIEIKIFIESMKCGYLHEFNLHSVLSALKKLNVKSKLFERWIAKRVKLDQLSIV